jgi:hypothetical protein
MGDKKMDDSRGRRSRAPPRHLLHFFVISFCWRGLFAGDIPFEKRLFCVFLRNRSSVSFRDGAIKGFEYLLERKQFGYAIRTSREPDEASTA